MSKKDKKKQKQGKVEKAKALAFLLVSVGEPPELNYRTIDPTVPGSMMSYLEAASEDNINPNEQSEEEDREREKTIIEWAEDAEVGDTLEIGQRLLLVALPFIGERLNLQRTTKTTFKLMGDATVGLGDN